MAEVDTTRTPAEILRDTDRDSYGVVRILADSAGTPGEEREYKTGDEALVEHGAAEWVVAPVHHPSAGRRLDADAEREPMPKSGVEAYPPAEPTTAARRAEARREGFVRAHVDEGVGEKLAARRAEVGREMADRGDADRQAALGSLGARSGPVTAVSDLPADKMIEEASAADANAVGADANSADKSADKPAAQRPGTSTPKGK